MKKIFVIIITVCCGLLSISKLQGQTLNYLETTTSARSAAMGNTMLGHTDEMFIYTNPSALLFSNKSLSLDFSSELYPETMGERQVQYNLSGAYNFGNQALFVGARYLKDLMQAYTYTVDLAYAFKLGEHFVAYASGAYFRDVVVFHAQGAAFSVGLAYNQKFAESEINLGARLLDFGKAVKYNDTGLPFSLPMSLVLGGDWQYTLAQKHLFSYALSTRYVIPKPSQQFVLSTGVEYTYDKLLSARLGYEYAQDEPHRLTMGLGAKYWGVKFNASYQKTFEYYGQDKLMLGLGFDF